MATRKELLALFHTLDNLLLTQEQSAEDSTLQIMHLFNAFKKRHPALQASDPRLKAADDSRDVLEGLHAELGGVTQTTGAARVDAVNQRFQGDEDSPTYDAQDSNTDPIDTPFEAKKFTDEEEKKKALEESAPDPQTLQTPRPK